MGTMQRFWSCFVCLVLVLGLGIAQAPRLCRGDGQGHACSLTTCHCEADCTCHGAHVAEARARAIAAAAVCGDDDRPAPVGVACHSPERGQDFGLPQQPWTAILPALPPGLALDHPREALPNAPPAVTLARLDARERPPRPFLFA